jgi:hypothetical protein
MIRRVSKNRKSGFTEIAQAAFFGLAVLLATGCSSTGGGVSVAHQGSGEEGNGFYQPPENPDLNDTTGPD